MTGIVVGIDGSECSAQALTWAAHEAELRGLPLKAVMAWGWLDQHHITDGRTFDPSYGEREARAALDTYVERVLGREAADPIERSAVCDLPAAALLEASHGATLLVVGARGLGGFRGLLLGSVSQQCLHHTTCPIAIIRENGTTASGDDRVQRVVVGIDESQAARRALSWAVDEARVRQASLEVLHVWQPPLVGAYAYPMPVVDPGGYEDAARRFLDTAVDSVDTRGLVNPVEPSLVCGAVAPTILEAGKGADLLVVGSRGHGGFTGLLLGSVSHKLAHHATCPFVVVPPGD